MKKIICALFGLFISVSAFADSDPINNNPGVRIPIPWWAIDAVVSKNADLVSDLPAMQKKYEEIYKASSDKQLTTDDMWKICKAGKKIHASNVCYERILLPVLDKIHVVMYADACLDGTITEMENGVPRCIDDVFTKEYEYVKHGPWKSAADAKKNGEEWALNPHNYSGNNPKSQVSHKKDEYRINTYYKVTSKKSYAQNVDVSRSVAFGFAIEYMMRDGFKLENISCTSTVKDDWINCTAWKDASQVNYKYYTFKFAGTNSTSDPQGILGLKEGLGGNDIINGMCALFAVDDLGLLDAAFPGCAMNCLPGTYANEVIPKFGLSVRPESTSNKCMMYTKEVGNGAFGKVVREYPGYEYMSYAFKNVQTKNDQNVRNVLKAYVELQDIDVDSFECDYAPWRYQNQIQSGAYASMPTGIDSALRCKINGIDVDFIFDDLFESSARERTIGNSGMKCLLIKRDIGGTASFDGANCRGPGKDQCLGYTDENGNHVKGLNDVVPGGTSWDAEAGLCVMNDAAAAKKLKKGIQIGIGTLFVIGVTVFSGGTAGLVFLEVSGSLALDWSFEAINRFYETRPNKLATEFVKTAENCGLIGGDDTKMCSNKTCIKNMVSKYMASIGNIIGDGADTLNDDQLKRFDGVNERVNLCLTDAEIRDAIKKSEMLTEDKVMSKASATLMVLGFVVCPSNLVSKLRGLKNTYRLLTRAGFTHIEATREVVRGVWHNRIRVDGLNQNQINRLEQGFKDQKISFSNKTIDGKRYFEFSNEAVDRLANVRSEVDRNIDYMNSGKIRRFYLRKDSLSESEWKVLREDLNRRGFKIVDSDDVSRYWVIRASGGANSNRSTEIIASLNKSTGASWEYKSATESYLGYSHYRVNLSNMSVADAQELESMLRNAGVHLEVSNTNKGRLLIVREEHIGDVGKIRPKGFENGAGARAGQNANAAGAEARFAGETPVNPELTVNVTRTDKGIKIEQREFVSAVDENGDKYFRYMFNEMDGGAPESARRFANNLRESGVDAFVVEHNGVYGVGVYERTLKNIDGVASATASGVRYHADLDAALDLAKTNPTKASRQLLQKYHPDKMQYHTDEIDKLATEITRKINNGLDKMSDAELRELGRQMNQLDDMLVQAAKKVNINPSKNLDDLYSSTHVLWEYDDVSGVYRTKTRYVTMDVDGQIALENMFNKAKVRMELDDAGYLIVREEHIGDLNKASSVAGAKNVGNASAGFMGRLNGWKVDNVELVRSNSRNAVFKFKEKSSGKTYYLKHVGDQDEIARTKRAYEILGDNSGIVHTARVVEDDQDVLIDFITKNNLQQTGGNYWMLTEEVPSSVAFQGNVYNGELKNALRGKPITIAEQQEIRNAIKKLNDGGIVHGDLYPNMLFMRESNGKLRVDLIDYENLRSYDKFADERWLDNMFNELRGAGLAD